MEQKDESLFALEFDHQASAYIVQSAKWSKFMSIVWFVLCGLIVLASFFIGSLLNASANTARVDRAYSAGYQIGIILCYIIMAAILLVPNILRYQFAVKALRAVRDSDQQSLNDSLRKLGTYNKYWGILTIIVLAIYILAFLFGGLSVLAGF